MEWPECQCHFLNVSLNSAPLNWRWEHLSWGEPCQWLSLTQHHPGASSASPLKCCAAETGIYASPTFLLQQESSLVQLWHSTDICLLFQSLFTTHFRRCWATGGQRQLLLIYTFGVNGERIRHRHHHAGRTPLPNPNKQPWARPVQSGKNSGVGSCLSYYIPITNGRWKTWRPQTLAPPRWTPKHLVPSLVMWCLSKNPAVKQHLISQLICCLHPSHLPALMTSISFYCFSLGKHKEEAAEKVSWMLLL